MTKRGGGWESRPPKNHDIINEQPISSICYAGPSVVNVGSTLNSSRDALTLSISYYDTKVVQVMMDL